MGTTAQKLTYLNETKQELKQAINNLGGSIDDNTTFREYVEELQDIYDNLPKTEYQEGTEVNLGVTSKGKLDYEDGKVGYGQTEQGSTKGYQMYCLPPSKTLNGITYTNNGDGTCDIVGTATANVDFALATRIPIAESPIQLGETYNISVLEALPDVTFQVVEYASNGTWIATTGLIRNSQSQNITIPNNSNVAFIDYNIRVYSGATVNAKGIKLMMNTGTSRKDFEQYTGGYSSPSPNWEQRVECVTGRNKLNLPDSTRTIGDMTVKTLNNKFSCEGSISSTYLNTLALDYSLKAGTYIISSTNNDYKFFMWLKNENDTTIGDVHLNKFTQIIKLTEDVAKIHVGVEGLTANTNYNIETYFQIEEGPTAHPYMPYNTIEETIHGKNILGSEIEYGGFDDSGAKIDGYSTYRNATPIPIKPNKQYIFSINGTAKNINKFYYDRNMNLISKENNVYPLITTPNNAYYLNIYKSTADGDEKWQIVEGAEGNTYTLTYEPYITPTSYQLSLGDIQLCGIGNYKDELIYDVENDKVYKNEKIKKINLAQLVYEYQSETTSPTPRTVVRTYGTGTFVGDWLSNIFVQNSTSSNRIVQLSGEDVTYISIANDITGISGSETENQKVQKIVSVLSEKNAVLITPKATPTLIEITDTTLISQVKALYNAHSFNGTTILEVDGDLPMIIKVRALKGAA